MQRDDFVRRLDVGDGREVHYVSLDALSAAGLAPSPRLPFAVRVLLESAVRHLGHPAYAPAHVKALASWRPDSDAADEIPFLPARVLFQDFTGVPCVADLAALRSALQRMGGKPGDVEPLCPADLVIDHSVQLDEAGHSGAYDANIAREFERNRERYVFLRWGQNAFARLRVLPPGLGICHQVNMEYLATCVATETDAAGRTLAYPDTLVGTDSHTVMINSMGILGWGVGGIEAEAAMLGQPIPLVTPRVVGVRLTGRLQGAATATDLALTVTEVLRKKGVVERFVEFFGPGLDHLSLYDRAPVANMAPEYGATSGLFPIDAATLAYLRDTGRDEAHIRLVEAYAKAQGLWRDPDAPEALYNDVVEIDLAAVKPSVAGPKRPQDRIGIGEVGRQFDAALTAPADRRGYALDAGAAAARHPDGLEHGAVVIASITSCTNTSNPALLIAAALIARRAAERGLTVPSWVRTSFAPGSRVAASFLRRAGLLADLEKVGFHIAAYGCATCIGNSGPLPAEVEAKIRERKLVAAAVLSGNRNFEGRVHPLTRANYLCSPPLVMAYALRGTVRGSLETDPVGAGSDGQPVYLRDLWPSADEIAAVMARALDPADYREAYGRIAGVTPAWETLPEARSETFAWDPDSTYIREPPFVTDLAREPAPVTDVLDAAVLAVFGDFITTDHISPAGSIAKDGPAAKYLVDRGVAPRDFNSYGSRRGNHEVMMRGTFANIRIRNRLADREGGWTRFGPTGGMLPIFEAAMRHRDAGTPTIVLAGKMYGAGSSRDWAAKGPALLGVRAVIAESFERIHRSNLAGMGLLPLEFPAGQNAASLGLTGDERFSILGLARGLAPRMTVRVEARKADGASIAFDARVRLDTAVEVEYFRHGGILPYVLRGFLRRG